MSDLVTLRGHPNQNVTAAALTDVLNKLADAIMDQVREEYREFAEAMAKDIRAMEAEIAKCHAEIARTNRAIETERRLRLGGRK